jgi:asparagine synthase (glutamine-hydrolysing)
MCGIYGNLLYKEEDTAGIINAGYSCKVRGPERTITHQTPDVILMFHRLAIMETSPLSDQPHIYKNENDVYYILCNGEIYNYKSLAIRYLNKEYSNDTSVIYPLFEAFDYDFIRLNNELNGEYSIVIIKVVNNSLKECWMSTDPLSVRPLFVSSSKDNITFSSLLLGISNTPSIEKRNVIRLQGGWMLHFIIKEGKVYTECMKPYIQNIDKVGLLNPLTDIENVKLKVIATLENAVINRLNSDRPIGCLLSGGLDSSLVAGIAARELKDKGMKLKTFSIGMTGGTDLKYARMVADYIDSEHTEVIFTPEEGLSVLEDVIKTTETFDITTIRASVGQYLLSKWISQNTDIKVILNGDGADECQMGYLYNYYSPSHIESHKDCIRLLDNIHLYDGLRVDRCISRWGLEARVPYLDKNFVNLYKIIHPNLKMPIRGERMEKWLIRSAFERSKLIPKEVLWRIKEAFSDGVSNTENSWFSILQKHTIPSYNKVYIHCPPISNESRYYREIFEKIFGDEVSHVIPYFWMPKWIQSNDPSARTLPLYVG